MFLVRKGYGVGGFKRLVNGVNGMNMEAGLF